MTTLNPNSMTRPTTYRAATLLGLALLAIAPALSLADATQPESASMHVTLADLDLTSATGFHQARVRLAHAAWRTCEQVVAARYIEGHQAMLDCVGDAMARVMPGLEQAASAQRLAMNTATAAKAAR